MPALPFVPGVAKLTVVQNLAGVSVYNVLHAVGGNGAGYTVSELNTLASGLRTAWVTNVIPLQSGSVTLTDVIADDLSNDLGGRGLATGSNTGTASGTTLPANCATCWSWKITNRYRGGHPRTYIAGLTTTGITNANTLTTTHQTAHATAAAAVRTAVNAIATTGGTWILGCVSYYKDNALRPDPIFRAYTGVSVDSRIDSQRRRLGRDRT